jgi:inorganic triphosphatase YgiF
MRNIIEVELKLRAETDAPLRALAVADRLGPAQLGSAIEVQELDRYLDTPDGRLATAGWACRLRTRQGSTRISLKGPAQHAAGAALHRRPEIEGPADATQMPAEWPESAARQKLFELSGGMGLVERLALHQLRVERVASMDGQRVATLSLDRVKVKRGGVDGGEFLAVELELDDAALSIGFDAAPLTDAVLATRGLAAEPLTKLQRALALLDSGAA